MVQIIAQLSLISTYNQRGYGSFFVLRLIKNLLRWHKKHFLGHFFDLTNNTKGLSCLWLNLSLFKIVYENVLTTIESFLVSYAGIKLSFSYKISTLSLRDRYLCGFASNICPSFTCNTTQKKAGLCLTCLF